MAKFFIVLISVCVYMQPAWSRPVSYPDGITSIITNNGDAHSWLMHYSPTAKYSVGLRAEYRRAREYTLSTVQLNNLLKRWNEKNSQANLYVKTGLGVANSNGGVAGNQTSAAAFTGIAADWETRRYFISYENRYIEAGSIDDLFVQQARIGIAPYIADFGQLHTWLMLQFEHEPEGEDTFTVTPLVRFFKGVHRVETGVSSDNDLIFNWTMRF